MSTNLLCLIFDQFRFYIKFDIVLQRNYRKTIVYHQILIKYNNKAEQILMKVNN